MSSQDARIMKKFLLIAAVGQIFVSIVAGSLSGASRAEAKVREVAVQVVQDEWLKRLEAETKRIAADAAERAAERAVQTAVVPLIRDAAEHEGKDQGREKRIDGLERRLERIEVRR